MVAATTTTASILIVDDEPNMRSTLADILCDEGYTVTTAETGEEAVKLCADHRYDVIIMDVRMPGISGVEAFRRIRRHQEGARVILMSAFSVEELSRAALDEGAVAFLPKPLDVDTLVKLISEIKDTAILVVENETGTATSLSSTLKEQGYRVTMTSSPTTALELAEQIRFDIIFIAANLPSMNGLELYLAIKRITPTAIAIMMAEKEEEFLEIAREAVRRTAYTFVKKPLDLDHVLGLLRRITGERPSGVLRKP